MVVLLVLIVVLIVVLVVMVVLMVLIVVLVLELAEGKKTIRSTLWLRRKLSKRSAVGLIRRVHEGVHPSTEKTKGIDKLR
jgi:hypothetical protein